MRAGKVRVVVLQKRYAVTVPATPRRLRAETDVAPDHTHAHLCRRVHTLPLCMPSLPIPHLTVLPIWWAHSGGSTQRPYHSPSRTRIRV